jgi:SAM-dependent methyltransferase
MTTAAPASPAIDLEAIKRRQQATWASGDFSVVAPRVLFAAELLCEAADLQAGWRVLDVATGSGNAALGAARRGCATVGVDYVPALLDRGRLRAQAEHLSVEFVQGDAEKLPFENASFDAVLSIYGVMFAPDHRRAAGELARVCRPGGRIGLAIWTPGGYIGEMFKVMSRYISPTPGLTPPVRWGDESHLRDIFGGAIKGIRSHARTAVMRFQSAAENIAFFRTYYGPTLRAFESLSPDRQGALTADLTELIGKYDRNKAKVGPIAIEAEYLETVITRV